MPSILERLPTTALLILAVLLATSSRDAFAADEHWPGFRGPTGQGLSTSTGLPVKWGGPDNENVLWSSPLVGEGHASPIVWGDRLFVCTVRWPEDVEDPKKVIPEHHVLCYDATSGKRRWDVRIGPGPWLRADFRSGPGGGYAAPTPVTDGKHVFVAFGSAVLAAVDFDGNLAWRRELVPHTFDVTLGSSPVLFGNTVILLHAMAKASDSRLVAYDKATGEETWSTPMPRVGFGHSTPLLVDVGGKPQLLTLASGMKEREGGLQAFDPATGKRLWDCKAAGDAASPAYGSGIVYVDNGRGGPGIAVDPTGSGDVTESHVKWRTNVPGGIASPLIVGDLVYRVHKPGVLKCWRADSGEEVYAERLPDLGSTWASPVADAAGRLYFASAGKSYVVKAGEEFEVLAVNDLGDPNHASPAIADNRMYLVGTKKVWCIEWYPRLPPTDRRR